MLSRCASATPDRLSLANVTLLSVIRRAFRVLDPQIVGAPDWVANVRYDVDAIVIDRIERPTEN